MNVTCSRHHKADKIAHLSLNNDHLLTKMYDHIWYLDDSLSPLALNDNHPLINMYDHIWYIGGKLNCSFGIK